MRKKKIIITKKDCFLCYDFPFGEFTEEDIKRCAEHWMDAENCSNWVPIKVFVSRFRLETTKKE